MKYYALFFFSLVCLACKPKSSNLASSKTTVSTRAAHDYCRPDNTRKSDLLLLFSLGNNWQQGYQRSKVESYKTFYKGDTFVSDKTFQTMDNRGIECLSTVDLLRNSSGLFKDKRTQKIISDIGDNLASGNLFNTDSQNLTNTTVNGLLNLANGISEMIRGLIHSGILSYNSRGDDLKFLISLRPTGILNLKTAVNGKVQKSVDIDLNSKVGIGTDALATLVNNSDIPQEERSRIVNSINLAKAAWLIVRSALQFDVSAQCYADSQLDDYSKFKCNVELGFGKDGEQGLRLPLTDPRDIDLMGMLFKTGPQQPSLLTLMLGYDCSPLQVDVLNNGHFGSNLCRRSKAGAEMTYIFGKTNDSELFEDVTLTVKNIGLALRTVAGDDSLRNAWTKDGNLVTFVNGQLKPIGQENHSKFVYKGAYSQINNQTRENYTDSCIAPETPFKTQGNPSSLALFKDSDGSSSSRWADGDYTCDFRLPIQESFKRIRCGCTGVGALTGFHYFREYDKCENKGAYCQMFKLINKNLPDYCTSESIDACTQKTGASKSPEPSTKTCTNNPPSQAHTCEQQAAWGKCGESWMSGYCNKSCGRCQ